MTILSYKLGPGTLTIGAGPLDVSAQVTKVQVTPEENVETTDAIDVLSGEQLAEEEEASYKFKLEATFLQDTLATSGLIAYSYAHMGETVPFVFIPNADLDRKVSGSLRVVPLTIGGDVKKRNTSDVSFSIIGTPALADV